MVKYKLNSPKLKHSNGVGYITKDGHTMFNEDIVNDLCRLQSLSSDSLSNFEKEVFRKCWFAAVNECANVQEKGFSYTPKTFDEWHDEGLGKEQKITEPIGS